jgi:hypothetical protein
MHSRLSECLKLRVQAPPKHLRGRTRNPYASDGSAWLRNAPWRRLAAISQGGSCSCMGRPRTRIVTLRQAEAGARQLAPTRAKQSRRDKGGKPAGRSKTRPAAFFCGCRPWAVPGHSTGRGVR